MVAIAEAGTARAPMLKPAAKPSPNITAKAHGGNRLRFQHPAFVLKFYG
jgi:hypothetical protein